MTYECFKVSVEDYIATVIFDRPPVNAQNRRSREEMIQIFDELSDRDDVRVVVLTGAGRVFSAGADIKERVGLVKAPGDYIRHNRLTREFLYSIDDCSKPVIAAVNGAAIGAGFGLMLRCDIMIAADHAYFQMGEINVGLSGGMKFRAKHFSRSMSRYMYYTGRKIPATELYRVGVLSACVPAAQLMDTAMDIAREIASKSPLAISRAKAGFNVVEEMPERDAYRYEQTITVDLSKSEDTREAQRAFVEKRKPVFKGR
jgi:enoyl-CoA hydratase